MKANASFGRFFLPGPTEVRPDILAAQAQPMIGHRGPEMSALMERLQAALKPVFRTSRPVVVSTSSATGLMEAAVRNGVERRALALVNGAFSERFAGIVEEVGLDVQTLDVPWGEAHRPEQVAEALRGGDFDAVVVVHSETSTGVLNPVEQLARVAHDAGAIILVDAVTSLAGSPVEPDALLAARADDPGKALAERAVDERQRAPAHAVAHRHLHEPGRRRRSDKDRLSRSRHGGELWRDAREQLLHPRGAVADHRPDHRFEHFGMNVGRSGEEELPERGAVRRGRRRGCG